MPAEKSYTVAWILWATLGWAGAHRFYVGRYCDGLAFLATLGLCFIGWIMDACNVNDMVATYNEDQVLAPLMARDATGQKLTYTQPPAVVVMGEPDDDADEHPPAPPLPPPMIPAVSGDM